MSDSNRFDAKCTGLIEGALDEVKLVHLLLMIAKHRKTRKTDVTLASLKLGHHTWTRHKPCMSMARNGTHHESEGRPPRAVELILSSMSSAVLFLSVLPA